MGTELEIFPMGNYIKQCRCNRRTLNSLIYNQRYKDNKFIISLGFFLCVLVYFKEQRMLIKINQALNKLCLQMQNAPLNKQTRNYSSLFLIDTILKTKREFLILKNHYLAATD